GAALVSATDSETQVGSGTWTATSPTDVRLVLRDGTHVAGIPDADTLSATAVALTNSGKILLRGTLAGPDINASNDEVYYLADSATGKLSELLREGTLLDAGDGSMRPAAKIAIFPNYSGSLTSGTSPFTDAGQLAFRVTFADDRQAIYIASASGDPVLIPEPEFAALVVGLAACCRRRAR
ncbi:MAG TPA: hypothetical protein VH475_23115, partial [Tepidisphaeraceae bacterium]